MILHAQAKRGPDGISPLVFLHGFSGDCREWQTVGEAFQDYSRLYIDLPGHGGSADISVSGFDDVNVLLRNTLLSYNIHNYWLVGYSLGGRVAMMAACQEMHGLCGLVVEGGHRACKAKRRAFSVVSRMAAGLRVFAQSRYVRCLMTGINSPFFLAEHGTKRGAGRSA